MNHGIIGALLSFTAIGMYLKSVVSCRRKLRKNGKRTNITGLILALTISLAIYGIIDISFVWVQTGMIIVFIYSAFGIEEDKLTDMQNELKNE
jgi:O-antigen ligase